MLRSDLRTYVLDRLGISSGDSARVTQINATLFREYQRLCTTLELAHAEADLIFTADDPLVDLPNDTGRVIAIRRGTVVLRRVDRQTFTTYRAGQGDSSLGSPVVYVMEAPTRIRVWPAPTESSNTGAVISYVVRPVAWTVDGDSPSNLPEEFHDLVAELTIVRIATSDEDPQLAASAKSLADELMVDLRAFLNQRTGSLSTQVLVPGLH